MAEGNREGITYANISRIAQAALGIALEARDEQGTVAQDAAP
jgi:hypothetical protein